MNTGINAINEAVQEAGAFVRPLFNELGKVIVGQAYLVERLVIGLLANGHVLLEGVPGLAKTLSVKSLANCLNVKFSRLQFTPDMLPADVIGTQIYNPQSGAFTTRKGPIFANLVLADEINRAPAKVQSALLEAMQELQCTIGDTTYALPKPFMVLATQNPLEQEGTYPLPEAQLDRFMLHVMVGYPTRDEERRIMERMSDQALGGPNAPAKGATPIIPQLNPEKLMAARNIVGQVYVDERIKDYILNVVLATRNPGTVNLHDLKDMIAHGASPRASIALNIAARAHAFLRHRGYVTPEDVKAVGPDVLRHRLIRTYEAEAEEITTDQIVRRIFDAVEVP